MIHVIGVPSVSLDVPPQALSALPDGGAPIPVAMQIAAVVLIAAQVFAM